MSTTELAGIGLKAIDYKRAVDARKIAAADFGEACTEWKHANGVDYIERGSQQWNQMLAGVRDALTAIKKANAAERNARERLIRACRREAA